jgi:uncharacterized protein YhaN
MKTLALLPTARDGVASASPISTSLSGPGLTVLLARSGEAKARILSSFQQGLSPAMRPQAGRGSALRGEAFVIRAQDVDASAEGGSELPPRLSTAGSAEEAARTAIAALRAQAAALLADEDGAGRIAELIARLREIDARLDAALQADEAERGRVEPLFVAASHGAELQQQRDRIVAERARWLALIQLWPEWHTLVQIQSDIERLSRFATAPADVEQRHAALTARREQAERTLRSLRRELNALLEERDELRQGAPVPVSAAAVARLGAELPVYRSRLLQLAATRARLAELDRTLATGVRRLGKDWNAARLSEIDLLTARRDELQLWQKRSARIVGVHADAQRAQDTARERLQVLCRAVNEELGRTPDESADEVDERWRALWQLRARLEEIWDVQSRAEANARTFAEREQELRRLEAPRYRTAPRWLLASLTVLAVVLGAAVGSGLWRGYLPGAALGSALTLLVLVRVLLHVRGRWIERLEDRRSARGERVQRDLDTARRQRDAGWARAGNLAESIRATAARLALPEPVTLEAVEAYEQELAAQLRSGGAHTTLTTSLRDLLDTQDEEQRAAARLDVADAERRALEREWQQWRTEAGLPDDLAIEDSETWLAELRRLAAARAARDSVQKEIAALEPVTATWETAARTLLAQAGSEVQPELCGSALATELTALATRVGREAERNVRRAHVESALHDAADQLSAAKAELRGAREEWQELVHALGVTDETGLRAYLEGCRDWRTAHDRVGELQRSIDGALAHLGTAATAAELRAALHSGQHERWDVELRRCDAQLERIDHAIDVAAEHRQSAARALDAARAAVLVGDLRLEREELRAELAEAAREWKLRALAAALLDGSLQEQQRATRRELLQAASRTLATLTRGRYTSIDRADAPAGLTVVDRDGRRSAVGAELGAGLLGQINLSLLLGRAAQLASRGTSLPLVLDDVLGPLSRDDAHLVAQEIATLARAHPVLYVTTAARRGDVLSAMPSGITVFDVE